MAETRILGAWPQLRDRDPVLGDLEGLAVLHAIEVDAEVLAQFSDADARRDVVSVSLM